MNEEKNREAIFMSWTLFCPVFFFSVFRRLQKPMNFRSCALETYFISSFLLPQLITTCQFLILVLFIKIFYVEYH